MRVRSYAEKCTLEHRANEYIGWGCIYVCVQEKENDAGARNRRGGEDDDDDDDDENDDDDKDSAKGPRKKKALTNNIKSNIGALTKAKVKARPSTSTSTSSAAAASSSDALVSLINNNTDASLGSFGDATVMSSASGSSAATSLDPFVVESLLVLLAQMWHVLLQVRVCRCIYAYTCAGM